MLSKHNQRIKEFIVALNIISIGYGLLPLSFPEIIELAKAFKNISKVV